MLDVNPIDAILARLKSATQTPVNPSVAAQVLDASTRAEVAGTPALAPAPAPVQTTVAPADAGKTSRRTAAVVQQELDAALARIAQLEAVHGPGHAPIAALPSGDLTTESLVQLLVDRGYRVGLSRE